jgi:hypothetical protein
MAEESCASGETPLVPFGVDGTRAVACPVFLGGVVAGGVR